MNFNKCIVLFDRALLLLLLWWLSSGERVGNWINELLETIK